MKDKTIVDKIWIFRFFDLLKKSYFIFKESCRRQFNEFNDLYQEYCKENHYF